MSAEQTNIIVEISPTDGIEEVSWYRIDKEELKRRSDAALDEAMSAITEMANRIAALHDKIPLEFSEVEVEFGIKLGYDVGVVLSKASTEANLNVTLKWSRPEAG